MPLQILITALVYFAASRIYRQWRAKNVTTPAFLFWFTLWSGILAVAYWPGLMDVVSYRLGIGRGVDAFLYFGLLLSLYLSYRIYIKYEEMSQDMTKVVRALALKDLEIGKDGAKSDVTSKREHRAVEDNKDIIAAPDEKENIEIATL